jgi:hypothetical protein
MIIGLCGAAGAGKDTVAERLVFMHGFLQFAFADPIYEAVSVITGLEVHELKDRSRKENCLGWISHSPRRLLQSLGTEWGRDMIHPEIWVMSLMQRVEGVRDAVITDVRFNNEAEAILARGGEVWRVVGREANIGKEASGHSSEGGVADKYVSATVQNSGTLDDLWGAVDGAYERLLRYTIE